MKMPESRHDNVSGHDFSRALFTSRGAAEFVSPPRQRWESFGGNVERQRRATIALKIAGLVLGLFLSAAPAFAQGCAMCYSNAAGSTKDGQKAISKGVIVLLVPPLGFMTVGMGLAVRYSRKRDEDSLNLTDQSGEL
jgi:hypothetical protein